MVRLDYRERFGKVALDSGARGTRLRGCCTDRRLTISSPPGGSVLLGNNERGNCQGDNEEEYSRGKRPFSHATLLKRKPVIAGSDRLGRVRSEHGDARITRSTEPFECTQSAGRSFVQKRRRHVDANRGVLVACSKIG